MSLSHASDAQARLANLAPKSNDFAPAGVQGPANVQPMPGIGYDPQTAAGAAAMHAAPMPEPGMYDYGYGPQQGYDVQPQAQPAEVAYRIEAVEGGYQGSPADLFVEHPSKKMVELQTLLARIAGLNYPLLIRGETGSGKDLAARYVHQLAQLHHNRPQSEFIAVNCGAIPAGLAESELFGHLRGAFTGAHRNHCGAFVAAGQGTIFLDEIGELPLDIQAKLLRVLESGCVRPVGGEREIPIRCRVIAATHRNLEAMVREGSFREDLFHRLAMFEARIPALRERVNEIPQIMVQLASEAACELGRPIEISPRAIEAAQRHPWPGNVRALRNALMRAAALSEGPIDARGLLPAIREEQDCTMIQIPRGNYAAMKHALLSAIVGEQGSIRKAARVLSVPRSTLGTWLRQGPTQED